MPTSSTPSSVPLIAPNFTIFSSDAPNITGTARKNVYSAATSRDVPMRMPPRMVAPERDVPGMSASTWNTPMSSASDQRSEAMEFTRGLRLRLYRSTNRKPAP